MNPARKITSYFKRPDFALGAQTTRSETPVEDPTPALQSSPSSELPQLPLSDGTTPDTPGGPSAQLKRSLLRSTEETANNDTGPQSSFQSVGTTSSFGSSQRVFKNGREVVISSDGEESDSTSSFEPPEELLALLKPQTPKVRFTDDSEMEHDSAASGRALRTRKTPNTRSALPSKPVRHQYKNTLDSLVMHAVDDKETEADIARLRASLKAESARESDSAKQKSVNEGTLASALDSGADDSTGIKRLLDAVRRTEAFELGKSWPFFDLQTPLPPPPDFPRDCVCPGTYLEVLREPGSRERAFSSGVIDFALSRNLLSDELVRWIFYSIPSESRESLRHAYCGAIKRTTAERMKRLVQPEDIDTLFWHMSARPLALALSDPIITDANPSSDLPESQHQQHTALLSVLDIFREAADLFSSDTRNRILDILLRLPLDSSLTRHSIICNKLERTITAVLEGVPDEDAGDLATRICKIVSTTLKDAELQSRLLEHIVPTNSWIATLRRRLALIFLTGDPHAELQPANGDSEVKRITNILRDPRFDVKRHKRKGQPEYDYGELRAVTTFLNIIIDSGWSERKFRDENAEDEFNREVDLLAERVKKIFTAIEDSGASHLRRTLAKEALESLHYRIVYSVRSKPKPKKVLFGQYHPEKKSQNLLKYINKKVPIRVDKPGP
ncbi:hypothetical protein BJX68DRAFT_241152 [Aspergillus pseudodeflectus]|uniref:Uncharacterized protein n=1 Tax=Aspergillus pseudodeflectus TaxID=176178 RepID=A0ABR4K1T8_9EURO